MPLSLARARTLLAKLHSAGGAVDVTEPLSEEEFLRIEQTFAFEFNPDHRTLLSAGLPVGERWPDWRDGEPEQLRALLAAPIEGVLFDVKESGFWRPDWGPRPTRTAAALILARRALAEVPQLVPVYGHRYAPALPPTELPVFSVVQTDVIVYGRTLTDYLRREFHLPGVREPALVRTVPFWSELAGADQ